MEINNMIQNNIASVRQALGVSALRKSMSQDAQSVTALLEGMQVANAKIMENSVTPYKGGNIDISV